MCLVTSFHCFYATLFFLFFCLFFLSGCCESAPVYACTFCVYGVFYFIFFGFFSTGVYVFCCMCMFFFIDGSLLLFQPLKFIACRSFFRVSLMCCFSNVRSYAYVFCFWLPFSKVYLLEGWHSSSSSLLLLLLFLVYILPNEIYLLSVCPVEIEFVWQHIHTTRFNACNGYEMDHFQFFLCLPKLCVCLHVSFVVASLRFRP